MQNSKNMRILQPVYEVLYAFFIFGIMVVADQTYFSPLMRALPDQHRPDLTFYFTTMTLAFAGALVMLVLAVKEAKKKSTWVTFNGHKLRLQGLGMIMLGFLFFLYILSAISAIALVIRVVR